MPHVDTPQSNCGLGVARCDVTPPVGIYHRMWGAATHDRSTGVHRPLTATVLVLCADGRSVGRVTEQVIVALDHCVLWGQEMDAFLAAVCRPTRTAPVSRGPLPPLGAPLAGGPPRLGTEKDVDLGGTLHADQVAVAFSHTHGAGLMGLERVGLPGGDLIPPYLDEMARRVRRLIAEARRQVIPATLTYATGHCDLATNRDFWDEDSQQWVCGFNPGGPVDDRVLVVRATDEGGRTIATVVNYACHPTTLAWENTLISPDYVGAMREVIEPATGAPCAFLQGASGDIGPREGFVGDPAVADRNGRQLGYAALAALETMPPPGTRFQYTGPVVSGATLGAWAHVPLAADERGKKSEWSINRGTFPLAYRPEIPTLEQTKADRVHWHTEEEAARQRGDLDRARDCRAMVERMDRWLNRLKVLPGGKEYPLPITLLKLGDAFWLTLESEHYNVLQRALRERFPQTPIVVATVVNGGRATYLPPADIYGKGIYQESIAVLAPGSLEKLIDGIAVAMEKML
jgi:hypothetical protein